MCKTKRRGAPAELRLIPGSWIKEPDKPPPLVLVLTVLPQLQHKGGGDASNINIKC